VRSTTCQRGSGERSSETDVPHAGAMNDADEGERAIGAGLESA
jgi:hypothetical protein